MTPAPADTLRCPTCGCPAREFVQADEFSPVILRRFEPDGVLVPRETVEQTVVLLDHDASLDESFQGRDWQTHEFLLDDEARLPARDKALAVLRACLGGEATSG